MTAGASTVMPKLKGDLLIDEPRSPDGTEPRAFEDTNTVIDLYLQAPAWKDELPEAEVLARRAALAALSTAEPALPLARAELSLVLASDAFVRELNRDYRGKDTPTNVLSFPALDDEDATREAELMLGDVILALETCQAEAQAQGKRLEDHVSHLTVHGVLHLLGFNHLEPDEAKEMEALEVKILAQLGIGDPYGEG